jgi:hypothetical protein
MQHTTQINLLCSLKTNLSEHSAFSCMLWLHLFACHTLVRHTCTYSQLVHDVLLICLIPLQVVPEHILPWLIYLVVTHADYLDPDEDSSQVQSRPESCPQQWEHVCLILVIWPSCIII